MKTLDRLLMLSKMICVKGILILTLINTFAFAETEKVYMTSEGRRDGYSVEGESVTKEEFVAHRRNQIASEKAELERVKAFGQSTDEQGRPTYIDSSDGHGHTYLDDKGNGITIEQFEVNADFASQEAHLREIENTQHIIYDPSEPARVMAEHKEARKKLKEKREEKLKAAGLVWE